MLWSRVALATLAWVSAQAQRAKPPEKAEPEVRNKATSAPSAPLVALFLLVRKWGDSKCTYYVFMSAELSLGCPVT